MDTNEINKILFHVLKTIYHFERNEIMEYSLDFQEVYVLQFLKDSQEKNIGEIADELNIKHFSASRLVTRLEKKGYVIKKQEADDKRKFNVGISESGFKIVHELEANNTRTILSNLEKNPELDIESLIDLAENIHKILDTKKKGD